ncbi:hypothetical protein BDA99DRAFT_522280 [Phascolomyces articulosus]|uniref:Uncharacterized protein n=1 Tax=Phascolomyces articulosus TaxID=60185 RepID=A0AAD5P9N5_9FUNG|nr:hypothetical protein BDA99DRAFT_522280 [Phascolomyces articulosus]
MSFHNENASSIYDSLPMLDSWYNKQPITSPSIQHFHHSSMMHPSNSSTTMTGQRQRQRHNKRCQHQGVSFSMEPPSIHYVRFSRAILDNDHHEEEQGCCDSRPTTTSRIHSVKSIMKNLIVKHTRRIMT